MTFWVQCMVLVWSVHLVSFVLPSCFQWKKTGRVLLWMLLRGGFSHRWLVIAWTIRMNWYINYDELRMLPCSPLLCMFMLTELCSSLSFHIFICTIMAWQIILKTFISFGGIHCSSNDFLFQSHLREDDKDFYEFDEQNVAAILTLSNSLIKVLVLHNTPLNPMRDE